MLLKFLAHAIAEPLSVVISVHHFSVHGRARLAVGVDPSFLNYGCQVRPVLGPESSRCCCTSPC